MRPFHKPKNLELKNRPLTRAGKIDVLAKEQSRLAGDLAKGNTYSTLKLPSDGYFEIWARATDSNGAMQPHQAGFWNPQGYGGNAMHRIALLVG